MKPQLLSVGESAAYGAKLAGADAAYYSLSTHALGSIDAMKKLGLHPKPMESFQAAIHAASGSEIGGKRALVLSSVSSCDCREISYMRVPVVAANVWPHDKAGRTPLPSFRDSGFIVFLPESTEEIVDTIIQAFKVSESRNVLTPSVVNTDMSGFQEPARVPEEKFARNYVSKFLLPHQISEKKHQRFNSSLDPSFVVQQRRAMKNVAAAVGESSESWRKKVGRRLPMVEAYKLEDSDYAIIVAGFGSTTAKAAVNRLRSGGVKAGLLRIRVFSPWPAAEAGNALKNVKKFAVFDQSLSAYSGTLHAEAGKSLGPCSNFILVGRHPEEKDFINAFDRLAKSGKEEVVWLS